MFTFTNEHTLNQFLKQQVAKAVNIVADKIYEQLLDFIQKDIYDTYPQPAMYERTYEFRDKAWLLNLANDIADTMVASISYFPAALSYNPEKYQHGSRTQDRSEQLAEILNRNSPNWDDWNFGRPRKNAESVYPKPFWDDTIKWVTENWDKEVINALNKVGLNVKKV